ncbi:MAG TPA: hypothetical protein ENN80_00495, partial [Candidatus Hydrogenedentes bacterium]|nr:hypothetical protein [Candidatus Hydrogenedentota bacterium]
MNTDMSQAYAMRRRAPWAAFLIIGVVFFYTLHNVFHTRDYLSIGATAFIPTDETVEELVSGWERGKLSSGIAYATLGLLGLVGLLARRRNTLRFDGVIGGFSLVYITWACVSLLWAQDVVVTAKAVVIIAMVGLALIHVVRRFTDHDLLVFSVLSLGAY